MIGNNLLFGYAGEAYLYAWAKGRGVGGAAFGAVKDVAILSAAVGNRDHHRRHADRAALHGRVRAVAAAVGAGAIAGDHRGAAITALALRQKLFSRSSADLRYIAACHGGRAAVSILMTGLLWQLALPGVALLTWVVLSALKLLVSRLPLISQKDVVFAGVSVVLLGKGTDAAALIALMATLSIAADVVIGIGASLFGIAGQTRRRAEPAVQPALLAA